MLAAGLAVAVATPERGQAEPAATCTAAQKTARTAALAAFKRATRGKRLTAKQRARLTALKRAAACTVPTLPPSSGASCSFMLERNREAILLEPQFGGPFLNVGPLSPGGTLPASGRADAVLLFVDFPNASASETASALATSYTAYANWFAEASYGRFSLSVTTVPTWFRMPRAGSEYSLYSFAGLDAYLADVIAAADSAVNFAQYDAVWVVAEQNAGVLGNTAFARFPGRGVRADGGEVRFGAVMGSGRWPGLFHSTVAMHEHLHSMGLPDLGYSSKVLGRWDPMFADTDGSSTTHVLAWHKWLLGWIDPGQITCLEQPGQLEETLTPLARTGGKKMVVVPTGSSTAYAIEVRRRLGYDRTICAEGVLLYKLDSQVRNGEGPVEGRSATTRCSPQSSPLGVGQTYEDGAIKLEVLATDGSAYRVRVTKR